MNTTPVFDRNVIAFTDKVRRIVNKGGTSSSKTVSILQLLLEIAIRRSARNSPITISVVSETLPHLRKGAIRDFEIILKKMNRYNERYINQSNHQYFFGGSMIEFFSADTVGKATGPRRDILYLNECNNLHLAIVKELEMRTNESIFYDYNPVAPFWIDDHILNANELKEGSDYVLIKSNYLDNPFLPDEIIKTIQVNAKRDPNFKRIHIDLEYGVYEGLIFPDWVDCDRIPEGLQTGFGMDFGFTNDPTTLIEVGIHADNLYLDEHLYQTGMFAPDIVRFLKTSVINKKEIIADSSDPRMIEEIRRAGFNIHPAIKGPGSIQHGIDSMKRYKIHITKRSLNLRKELRSYQWKITSSGERLNEPVDFNNHAIDAGRYRVAKMVTNPSPKAPNYHFRRER